MWTLSITWGTNLTFHVRKEFGPFPRLGNVSQLWGETFNFSYKRILYCVKLFTNTSSSLKIGLRVESIWKHYVSSDFAGRFSVELWRMENVSSVFLLHALSLEHKESPSWRYNFFCLTPVCCPLRRLQYLTEVLYVFWVCMILYSMDGTKQDTGAEQGHQREC